MERTLWLRTLLFTALPLAAVGGLIAFVLLPRVIEGRRVLVEARERFLETTQDIRGLERVREGLNRVDQRALKELFVPAGRPLGFIETLENLASRSGSTIEIVFLEPATVLAPRGNAQIDDEAGEASVSSQTSAETKKAASRERGFEVRLRGSFRGALQFLNALERQAVLVRVDDIMSQPVQEIGEAAPKVLTTIRLYAPTLD